MQPLETSAHTLANAILLMALYPDVQNKLREESFRVWPTLDDVETSTYKRDFDRFVSLSLAPQYHLTILFLNDPQLT